MKKTPNFSIHDPNLDIRWLLMQTATVIESQTGVKMSRSQVIRFLAVNFINSHNKEDV